MPGARLLPRSAVVAVMTGLVALAAGVALAVPSAISSPADATLAADRVDAPSRALLVSDSAWLGIKTYGAIDAVMGFPHMLDLASCRRRVSRSCRNFDGHVPIPLLAEVDWRADTYDTLIVATGYNDSDHDFRRDVDDIVALARTNGYRRIVWITLRSNVAYRSPGDAGFDAVFARNNAALRELVASGAYPEISIADWATYARDRHEWFAPDGIHLRVEGPWAAADYVSRKIAWLDGRPCPLPEHRGGPIATPCPDPDVGPSTIDIGALYPVGEPNPTAGFEMEWEGHGSWPAAPWWAP